MLTPEKTFSHLEVLNLMITERCNLRCSYCYQKKKNRTMTRRVAKKAIDLFLKNSKAKTKLVDIFGGEPLLCPELLEFVFSYALKADKEVGFLMITNGTILTPRAKAILERYAFAIKSLSISFDIIPKLHDNNRKFPDGRPTWELVRKNLRYLLEHFPELDVEVRFHPKDASRGFLIRYAEEARKLGVKRVTMMPLMGTINSNNIDRIAKEYALLYEWAAARGDGKDGLKISSIYPKLSKPDRTMPCGVATRTLFVASDGKIYPCLEFWVNGKKSVGTVFNPAYEKIFFFREYVFFQRSKDKYFRCPARMDAADGQECLYTSDLVKLDSNDRLFAKINLLLRKSHPEIAREDSKAHDQLPFCEG